MYSKFKSLLCVKSKPLFLQFSKTVHYQISNSLIDAKQMNYLGLTEILKKILCISLFQKLEILTNTAILKRMRSHIHLNLVH